MKNLRDDRRVIVIGSGPSGAMAALALLERGIPVTLLESGQNLPRGLLVRLMGINVHRRWPKDILRPTSHVASDDTGALWHHAFVPGGLSNLWTGAVPRFAPEDFTEGERLHERYRWPVSYDELVPYYERVERLLVVGAGSKDVPQLPASRAARTCQLPHDWREVGKHASVYGHGLTLVPLAEGQQWLIARNGAAFNSFTAIVQKLKRFPQFELLLGAHVLRLEWSGQQKRVRSVVYYDRATACEERADCAAVVVACGPLASTKLLLDSACSDFPQGLGDTEGLLGRYLHDHTHDWYAVELDTPLSRLSHTAYLTRAPYRESPPLIATSSTFGSVTTRDKVLAAAPLKTTRFGVAAFGTVVPLERNLVRLDPTVKDEFGLPRLDIHVHYDDVTTNMLAARERVLAILAAAGHRGRIVQGEQPHRTPGWTVHYGGTVRMHQSPTYGMLNGWNRLHAVENVIVADASSFTTGVEKNPTLTAMALAARAADRLSEELRTA